MKAGSAGNPPDSVTVTTVVTVPPEDAFRVFTREIGSWWRVGPRHRFGTRPGTMRFEPAGVGGWLVEVHDEATGEGFRVGQVSTWEPGQRLVFAWRQANFMPEESTEVEVLFEPVPEGTRITLHHRGWATLPREHPSRHGLDEPAWSHMMGGAWADLLAGLRLRIERGPMAERRNRTTGGNETP